MSRRIATYPFSKEFNDTLECDADSIKDFELPGVRMECFNFDDNSDEVTAFRSVPRAEEDREGIFIKLVEEDKDGNLTENESEEICVDEKKFCDAIYEAVIGGETAEESKFIQDCVYQLAKSYALSKFSGGKWYFRIDYDGFGVICSGDEIIGTVDSIRFNKEQVCLDRCIGNIDLNNVENCNVQFAIGDKCLKLTQFEMESVTSESENFCTYVLKNYHGEQIQSIPVPKEKIAEMKPYSEDTAEEFVSARVALIENDEEKDSTFDMDSRDIYDDLL